MQNGLALKGPPILHVMPAGVYASQSRDDFSADDVEHYFNYMGMLATEVGPMLVWKCLAWILHAIVKSGLHHWTGRSCVKRCQ